MEAMAANAKVQQEMNNQQLAEQQSQSATPAENAEQKVEGQKLEKQTIQEMEFDNAIYYSLAGILLLIICGAFWQTRGKKSKTQQIYLLELNQSKSQDLAA
jgi:hypothetical protein